jgi:hypothetical protein
MPVTADCPDRGGLVWIGVPALAVVGTLETVVRTGTQRASDTVAGQ